jgi:hypothetical protein
MRRDTAIADRKQSVREAAQEWLNAGWIARDAYQSIEKMYADDRVRTGTAFRILFFILTLVAISGILGAIYVSVDDAMPVAGCALIAGVSCWGITEYLILSKKRRQGGIEAAFSVAAIVNLTIGLGVFLFKSHWIHDDSAIRFVLLNLSLLAGAAAWNWGYWLYAVLSTGLLFSLVLSLPGDRLLWIALTIIIYPWLVRGCESPKLPPSLRKCVAAFLVIAIGSLYVAINIYLADRHTLDLYHRTAALPRWLFILLTAALPIIVFAIGVMKRRRLFLVLGFLLGWCSLITLRFYVHVAPLWVVVTGSGILLLCTAGALRRFLDSGVNRERNGFTAAPLAERPERHRGVEMLASIATLTPSAAPASENPQYRGGGGTFGGGGASGEF